MLMISDQVDKWTPEAQIGGVKTHGCRDHILAITSLMKANEARSLPTILTLVDLTSCFDRVRLNDLTYDVANCNVDLKALKFLHMMNQRTVIKMAGDHDDKRSADVLGSVGQGTGFAAKATGLSVSVATEMAIPVENCDKIIDSPTPPRDFVDDVVIPNKDVDCTRENGKLISNGMDLLALDINPAKSAVIVTGGDNIAVRTARDDLNANPVEMQGKVVAVKDSEPYLGFVISSGGFKKSVAETIKVRTKLAWQKTANIKHMVNTRVMESFGWFRACVTLMQSVLPAVLTYSAEVWAGVSKKQIATLESSYKDMIYCILDLPEKTKYSAVLLECGMLRIRHIVNKMQISYINHVVWNMSGTVTHKALMDEWKVNGDRSTLSLVVQVAASYGLPSILERKLDDIQIKEAVRRVHDMEVWRDVYESPIARERPYLRIRDKRHFTWRQHKAKALLAWRTGALRFKTVWRLYNLKRGLGINCVMPQCDGARDDWDHVRQCLFYDTKWDDNWQTEDEIADYLVKISRERFIKVKMPLF